MICPSCGWAVEPKVRGLAQRLAVPAPSSRPNRDTLALVPVQCPRQRCGHLWRAELTEFPALDRETAVVLERLSEGTGHP